MIRIKLSRKLGDLRMSQKELAERTGLRTALVNELYNEFVNSINLQKLDRICEVLNCQPGELLEYEPGDRSAASERR